MARLVILSILQRRPMHGYEIQQIIQEEKMEYWVNVLSGSIYFALNQMEKEGLIRKELAQGTLGSLRKFIRRNLLRIGFLSATETKNAQAALTSTGLVKFAEVRDSSVFINVNDLRTTFTAVNKWLLDRQSEFDAIEMVEPSLEEVFLTLTNSGGKREIPNFNLSIDKYN